MEAGCFACVGTRLSAREQRRACVKWDLGDRDFFHISNFRAPIFPLSVGDFFFFVFRFLVKTKISHMRIYT